MSKLAFKLFIIFIIAFCIYSSFALFRHTFLKQPEPLVFDAAEVDNTLTDPPTLETPVSALEETPLLFTDIYYNKVNIYSSQAHNINDYYDFITRIYGCIDKLEQEISSDKYSVQAQDDMLMEKARLLDVIAQVEEDIKDISAMSYWEDNYDTKTWKFLISKGYSEVIASAIIGNMRVETSGGRAGINPARGSYYKGGYYYGLCQWSEKYHPDFMDASFEEQLEYLVESMPKEFKTFGYKYKDGFTYEDFLNMTDIAEAALAFAKVYERCATWSFNLRIEPAKDVYEYYSLENN